MIKRLLIITGYYLGIFELIRVFFSKRGYVPILAYHRILDSAKSRNEESSFSLLGVGLSKSQFEAQVKYLIKHFKVISLKEYMIRKKNGQNLSGTAVITFDDGFRDSALEILRKYDLPATIFIITGTFKEICWRHMVYLLLDSAEAKSFTLNLISDKEIELSLMNPEDKRKAISLILTTLNKLPCEVRKNSIAEIRQKLGVRCEFSPQEIYLDENDIKKLAKGNIYFGAHSVTHQDLTTLDDEELLKEIEDSQELIRMLTNETEIPFSIPHGKYDKRVIEFLKQKATLCNLTSDAGLNGSNEDIYRLKRVFIDTHLFPKFVYKISGAEMLWIIISTSLHNQTTEFLRNLRSFFVHLIKRLDRLTYYKLGDIVRELTNVNTIQNWDKFFSKFNNFWRDFPYRFVIEFLPQNTPFSLLDIGCGLGDGCQLLKQHFPYAQIEGADFSPLAIKKAREKKLDINYFVLNIKEEAPPHRYDFINLSHILEHFNDPFPIVDKCLRYVNKAVLIVTPYVEKFDSPRLYWKGWHRYLFNENTFSKYKCTVLKLTEYISSAGYRYIVYKIEP